MFYPSRARPIISERDYREIFDLAVAKSPESAEAFRRAVAHFLVTAKPISKGATVGFGATVAFMDTATGVTKTVRLVGPDEIYGDLARVSVLSPLGLALLGLSPRDLVQWQLSPQVRRTLEIISIEPAASRHGVAAGEAQGCPDR